MGTRCAPTYANIFLGWLEDNMLKKWRGTPPHLWRRYIDDVLFFWSGTVEELEKFVEHLNKSHPTMKFVATFNPKTKVVPFLDMLVSVDKNGFIQTDLYRKETDRVQYLLPSSCHPSHITKNIPYSLAYRILRICSKPEWLRNRLEELRTFLLARQYHSKVIQNAFDRILALKRIDALKKVEKIAEKKQEVMVITFHPALPSMSAVIRKHWNVMISSDTDLAECFTKPSIVAYRRSKNLKDILVKAKIEPPNRTRKRTGFQRCKRSCVMCSFTIPSQQHSNPNTGENYKINNYIDCTSRGVIYKLGCKKCAWWTDCPVEQVLSLTQDLAACMQLGKR